MANLKPTPKVAAQTLTGLITSGVLYLFTVFDPSWAKMPADVKSMLVGGIGVFAGFAAGWLKKELPKL